jgi:hypothetical protein
MSKITTEDFISKYLGQKIYLNKDKHLEIKIGQLELELKLSDDDSELLLRSRYVGVSKLLKEKFETEWHKAAWKPEHSYITFSLGLPDHPVVLKPDVCQHILPGQDTLAYCSIPLSIGLAINDVNVAEYLLTVLSKTWFGEPHEGILGYSLKSQVLSSKAKVKMPPTHAICTIEIENRSTEVLRFDRLCLRTEYMGLFNAPEEKILHTSVCKMRYIDKDKMSKINYVPPALNGSTQIAPPRMKSNQGLIFKSFKTI